MRAFPTEAGKLPDGGADAGRRARGDRARTGRRPCVSGCLGAGMDVHDHDRRRGRRPGRARARGGRRPVSRRGTTTGAWMPGAGGARRPVAGRTGSSSSAAGSPACTRPGGCAGAATAVDVTLVDRRNYHLFQPLLYQVATGALSPGEIAQPLRSILRQAAEHDGPARRGARHRPRAAGDRAVRRRPASPYDTLVVATGARHSYFGHDEWAPLAPGPQDDRGRDRDPAPDPDRVRGRRARGRSRAPRASG